MNEVGFRREIFDFLRTGYGVTDAAIEGGGKHNALVFTRPNGPRIKTTWPRGPIGGQDWQRTLEIKRKDLVSMLGEPAPPPPKQRSKMEDLMPTLPPTPPAGLADQIRDKLPSLAAQLARDEAPVPPSPTERIDLYGCRMGCFRNGRTAKYIRLTVPDVHRDVLGGRISAVQVESDVWRVTPASVGTGVATQKYGSNVMGQWPYRDVEPFGYTPCSAWLQGGALFVKLPEVRAPLSHRSTQARKIAPQEPAPTTASGARWVEPIAAPTADDIRAALAMIRRIEAETTYRLVRDGDRWVFDPGLARIV